MGISIRCAPAALSTGQGFDQFHPGPGPDPRHALQVAIYAHSMLFAGVIKSDRKTGLAAKLVLWAFQCQLWAWKFAPGGRSDVEADRRVE